MLVNEGVQPDMEKENFDSYVRNLLKVSCETFPGKTNLILAL